MQMFTVIAAQENESPYILSNAIISMVMGFIQTLFINWYGFQKRATKEQHYAMKPGRQGLEVLYLVLFNRNIRLMKCSYVKSASMYE